MSHPPIQIVDEEDNVIGAQPMSEAHRQGKVHQISRIMVEDDNGNILLQKRSANSKRWPGCWDNSAAGHVDEGEDYHTAAVRELSEEIGITDVTLTKFGYYYSETKDQGDLLRRFNTVYKATVPKGRNTTLQESEVSEVRWFSLSQIKKLLAEHPEQTTDGLQHVIQRYY